MNSVEIIDINDKREYWLIRTYSGEMYSKFIRNGIIQIGWDEIKSVPTEIDSEFKKQVTENSIEVVSARSLGIALGNIHRFQHDIKIGDIIISPGYNSNHAPEQQFAIGIVKSDMYHRNDSSEDILKEIKTRDVEWISINNSKDELNVNFKQIFYRYNTISSIKEFSELIDGFLYPVYTKNNKLYITTVINEKGLIKNNTFIRLLSIFDDIIEDNYNVEIKSRINVSSPGTIVSILTAGDVLTLAGAFSLLLICGAISFRIFRGSVTKIKVKILGQEIEADIKDIPDYQKKIEKIEELKTELKTELKGIEYIEYDDND